MYQQNVTVKNKTGLHARPAALFVQTANKFKSEVFIEKEGKKVNAKSIMGMMTLGITSGETVTVEVDGSDEEEAIENIEKYLSDKE